ncbi:helix-turn-helix domain-containing protein [Chromobacterium haemolyticum]|uniref:helix-turn-helix domain-containing protein n=1 Tax=Chromobacterium haemolyticum TaxID=394935 RepID=UPI000D2FA5B9|nr:helix-turn-helix domain-containing protein [Chromobacterium haemolyticum]PTU68600.1 hypothetical protein DBB33_03655 [Chromobacterium haemolyticum]
MKEHEMTPDEYSRLIEDGGPVSAGFDFIITEGHRPTPGELKAARAEAGLTQQEACELVYVSIDTWRKWEAKEGAAGAVRMPAMAWELFLNKKFMK